MERIKVELTPDQVMLIESMGYVMDYGGSRIIHLPYFFEKNEGGAWVCFRSNDADLSRNQADAVEYVACREFGYDPYEAREAAERAEMYGDDE
jgi:hypothetical protein